MDGLSELLGKPHGRPVNVDLAGYYRWRRMWIDSHFQQKRSWFGKMLRGSDHDTALPEPNSAPTKLQDFRSGHYLINRTGSSMNPEFTRTIIKDLNQKRSGE